MKFLEVLDDLSDNLQLLNRLHRRMVRLVKVLQLLELAVVLSVWVGDASDFFHVVEVLKHIIDCKQDFTSFCCLLANVLCILVSLIEHITLLII